MVRCVLSWLFTRNTTLKPRLGCVCVCVRACVCVWTPPHKTNTHNGHKTRFWWCGSAYGIFPFTSFALACRGFPSTLKASFCTGSVARGPGWTNTVDGSEIPNNHLGFIKPVVNNGINYQPQLVSRISEPSTVVAVFYKKRSRQSVCFVHFCSKMFLPFSCASCMIHWKNTHNKPNKWCWASGF